MKEVNIYTAVSCTKKTGEGSFGYVLEFITEKGKATGTKVEHFFGTENQGNILAVLHAVERLKENCHLTIYTESSYLATGYTNWIDMWGVAGLEKCKRHRSSKRIRMETALLCHKRA